MIRALALASTLACLSQCAIAGNETPGVDKRQARQQERIERGIESGALNEREAARLERGQARVEHMEAHAKADGEVTKKERAVLQHKQDQQSRRIAKQKHDRQHQ